MMRSRIATLIGAALAFLCTPLVPLIMAVVDALAFPFMAGPARPMPAQPRSVFESRRAGLA